MGTNKGKGDKTVGPDTHANGFTPTMKLELDTFALTLNPIFTVKVV